MKLNQNSIIKYANENTAITDSMSNRISMIKMEKLQISDTKSMMNSSDDVLLKYSDNNLTAIPIFLIMRKQM